MTASREAYEELFRFLEKLGETLEKLTEIEKKKTAAVRKDDLTAVNECMKQEQAMSLSLRSMDIKREKLLAAVGLQGVPLARLVENCPEELRLQAVQTAGRLKSRYQIFRSASEVARTTLEVNLHQIEKIISGRGDEDTHPLADIRA